MSMLSPPKRVESSVLIYVLAESIVLRNENLRNKSTKPITLNIVSLLHSERPRIFFMCLKYTFNNNVLNSNTYTIAYIYKFPLSTSVTQRNLVPTPANMGPIDSLPPLERG